MEILKATISDAEEILKLQKLAYVTEAEIYGDFHIPPLTQALEEIKREFSYKTFLKAILKGNIVGSKRGYEKDGTVYIGKLAVHPGYRGKGIGSAIMGEMEKLFPSRRFELFTGSKSLSNIRLYERLGYGIFKTEPLGYGDIEMVYMEKRPLSSGSIKKG